MQRVLLIQKFMCEFIKVSYYERIIEILYLADQELIRMVRELLYLFKIVQYKLCQLV